MVVVSLPNLPFSPEIPGPGRPAIISILKRAQDLPKLPIKHFIAPLKLRQTSFKLPFYVIGA
jgi:hypothetical protein